MRHSAFTVVLDANVLYPAPLRDFLLRLALTGIYRARWTANIHEEWKRNLLLKTGSDPRAARQGLGSHRQGDSRCAGPAARQKISAPLFPAYRPVRLTSQTTGLCSTLAGPLNASLLTQDH